MENIETILMYYDTSLIYLTRNCLLNKLDNQHFFITASGCGLIINEKSYRRIDHTEFRSNKI